MKIGIVVAQHMANLNFLLKWEEFKRRNVYMYICEDRQIKECILPKGFKGFIFDYQDIEKDLGKNSWIIPRKTSAIKSYGFYKAYEDKCDIIITIDSDCFPDGSSFIESHLKNLKEKVTLGWTKSTNVYTRGFPYNIREKYPVVLSHGLWSNIPDLDAQTALKMPDLRFPKADAVHVIPQYNYFPLCGMNVAFKCEIAPIMYFGLQGPDYPFDRFDDIWTGIFVKKILDRLNLAVTTGMPSVEHRKQSNVYANLRKEAPGLIVNEKLWRKVHEIKLTRKTPADCYVELADKLLMDGEYWIKLKEAMKIWAKLFA